MAIFCDVVLIVTVYLIHEFGHIFMSMICGTKIKKIGLSRVGLYCVREQSAKRWKNILITFAGPAINLLMAIIFWKIYNMFALLNLVLGLFNLLPIKNSDGNRLKQYFRG